MKTRKKKQPEILHDFSIMDFGPHSGQQLRHVSALYLLSLVGSDELKSRPALAEYIERARRQLKAEAIQERIQRHSFHDKC